MKTYTTNPTTASGRYTRFIGVSLGVGLMTAFMMPAAAVAQSAPPVNLGTAGNFVILSKTGITNVPTSAITGDVGTSPITGAANHFTCVEVTGNIYSVDASGPPPCSIMDPTRLTTAVSDMETAYADAAGRILPDFTELGAGNISGLTLVPGLYKWSTGVLIASDVTFSGGPDNVWILQVAQNLIVSNGVIVHLSGGARARNIFWQVAGQVTLGTTSQFGGIILSQTAINLQTGASVNGRLFAQTDVTLQQNAVANPSGATAVGNVSVPTEFSLSQNYPNPFNPSTKIEYGLAKAAQVSLKVYNLLGTEVATLVNGRQEAGSYTVPFDANKGTLNLASGVYFYRLQAGTFVETKKLMLQK
jgi:hypothetical protein